MGLLLPMTAEEIITWTKYGTLSMTFREISGMFALLPTSEASPFQATAWIKERSSVHSFLCTFITRKKFKILKKYLVFFHCTIWDDGLRTGFLSFFFFLLFEVLFYLIFLKMLLILFLAVPGLHGYLPPLFTCGEWGCSLGVVHGLLFAVSSLVVEHRL